MLYPAIYIYVYVMKRKKMLHTLHEKLQEEKIHGKETG